MKNVLQVYIMVLWSFDDFVFVFVYARD